MNGIELVNLTPHQINLRAGSAERDIPPSGTVARVAVRSVQAAPLLLAPDGIPIPTFTPTLGEVEGLPEPREDVVYIVSQIVAQRCPERTDLVWPHELVRNERGEVVGCASFARLVPTPEPAPAPAPEPEPVELFTVSSTNGRWGYRVFGPDGAASPAWVMDPHAPHVAVGYRPERRGKVGGRDIIVLRRDPERVTVWGEGLAVDPASPSVEVAYATSLQSGREDAMLLCQRGDFIRRVGYRGRWVRVYQITDDGLTEADPLAVLAARQAR